MNSGSPRPVDGDEPTDYGLDDSEVVDLDDELGGAGISDVLADAYDDDPDNPEVLQMIAEGDPGDPADQIVLPLPGEYR